MYELDHFHFFSSLRCASTKVEQLDEDSSYDSDTEIVNSPHQNVSRNVSETLAQELLEDYSSVSISFFHSVITNPIPDLQQNIEIVVVSSFFFSSHTASFQISLLFVCCSQLISSTWSLL